MQTLIDSNWTEEFEIDYIEDADILEVFFVRVAGTDAVELTEDITLRFDRNKRQAVSLILNNYSYLVKPAAFGPRTVLLNIDQLPKSIQDIVLEIIRSEPVSRFLRMLTFSTTGGKPDAPLAVVELPFAI